MNQQVARFLEAPVCMGGVGGSGTRLGAEVMQSLGIYLGPLLNKASDNFSFPPLATQLEGIEDEAERQAIAFRGLGEFEETMHSHFLDQEQGSYHTWGWKIPGSFHWLPYTTRFFPGMKYVHFIRHGLDMAFSGNRNQIKNWGWKFGIVHEDPPTPQNLLDYWVAANNHAIDTATALLGDRFLLVDYDALCSDGGSGMERLVHFLVPGVDETRMERARSLVTRPGSAGRYRRQDIKALFSPDSISAVEALGFSVD